jgi:hypothetical protein
MIGTIVYLSLLLNVVLILLLNVVNNESNREVMSEKELDELRLLLMIVMEIQVVRNKRML